MALGALTGNDGLLYVDVGPAGTPDLQLIGFQRGLTYEATREVIDASHKGSDFAESVYGRQSGTMSLEALVPNPTLGAVATHNAIQDAMDNRNTLVFQLVERDGGDGSQNRVREADCLIGTISTEYPDNDVSVISLELTLQGRLTEVP